MHERQRGVLLLQATRHMKHECPKWKSVGGAEGTTVSRGRVYTMDGGK
ncbi:hypothetical protein A2U01_0099157, partial [Trifolium medium]|nr:hypothetical protein [Trifolium medium]